MSIFGLLNTGLPVPCYTTLCWRRKKLKIKITSYERGGPIDIVVDSTGVKMRGPGELLSQIKGRIGEVIGDGAYDRKEVYEAIERLGGQ